MLYNPSPNKYEQIDFAYYCMCECAMCVKDYNANRYARSTARACIRIIVRTKAIVWVQSRRHKHIIVISCVFHSPQYIGFILGITATYQLIE